MCVVNLKSAYDKVQWQLLRSLLQRSGVHSHMLGAVQSLYDSSLMSVRVTGQCGKSQSPSVGLRQGCPHQLAFSLMAYTTVCKPQLQLLGCKFGT